MPTATGNQVKLFYELRVQATYDSCCAEVPNCTIPLVITPPPMPSYGQVQAPAGWAPQMMNAYTIQMDAGNMFNAAAAMAGAAANAGAAMAGAAAMTAGVVSVGAPGMVM